jgi:hypothetical protein
MRYLVVDRNVTICIKDDGMVYDGHTNAMSMRRSFILTVSDYDIYLFICISRKSHLV